MASFTTRIKDEVTKIETNRLESIAEVCAYLKDNSEFRDNEIIMFIENASVARRMFSLIKRIYGISIKLTIRTQKKFVNKTMYILELKEKVNIITSDVENMFKNIKDYSEEEKMSYLKGIFLSCGSINDPSKSKYHLELLVKSKEIADVVID
jgi:DNA-binding protein WhiA